MYATNTSFFEKPNQVSLRSLLEGQDPTSLEAENDQLKKDLEERGVTLTVTFSDTLHDREIRQVLSLIVCQIV